MKQARIYMKRWLGINERSKQLSTDTWYLNFANQLLSLIDESPLYSLSSTYKCNFLGADNKQ